MWWCLTVGRGQLVRAQTSGHKTVMAVGSSNATSTDGHSLTIDATTKSSLLTSLDNLQRYIVGFDGSRLTCRIRTPLGRAFPTLEDLDILQSVLSVVGEHAPTLDVVPVFDRIDEGDEWARTDQEVDEVDGSIAAWVPVAPVQARLILPGRPASQLEERETRTVKTGKATATTEDATRLPLRLTDRQERLSFKTVAVGGTFDRFHAGHRLLLGSTALVCSDRIFIGIASDKLLQNKACKEKLQAYDARAAQAVDFTKSVRTTLEVAAGPLTDPNAPPLCATERDFDAIVVSEETVRGAEWINQLRRESGFHELVIVVVGLLLQRDGGGAEKISSSALRREESS